MFNIQEAAAYLAAMIDGEGTVTFRPVKGGHDRRVTIYNTDPGVVAATQSALITLGIDFKTYEITPSNKAADYVIWHIYISRRNNLQRLRDSVTLHSKKDATLTEMLATYKKGRPEGRP